MLNAILPSFFLTLSIVVCGNDEFSIQLKTEQNKTTSLCQQTAKLPHFFTNYFNISNILKFIFANRAPADVNNKEILFCTSESMWGLNVWDIVGWDKLLCHLFLYYDKFQISIPFRDNVSSMSVIETMELFNSSKLTYKKIFPRVSCIDFYDSTEKWYLIFVSERCGYYITYGMKYNDPFSGIHEFRGCGTFSIKNCSILPNE